MMGLSSWGPPSGGPFSCTVLESRPLSSGRICLRRRDFDVQTRRTPADRPDDNVRTARAHVTAGLQPPVFVGADLQAAWFFLRGGRLQAAWLFLRGAAFRRAGSFFVGAAFRRPFFLYRRSHRNGSIGTAPVPPDRSPGQRTYRTRRPSPHAT